MAGRLIYTWIKQLIVAGRKLRELFKSNHRLSFINPAGKGDRSRRSILQSKKRQSALHTRQPSSQVVVLEGTHLVIVVRSMKPGGGGQKTGGARALSPCPDTGCNPSRSLIQWRVTATSVVVVRPAM